MCLIPSGITRSDCGFSFGGLQNVYLSNRDNVSVTKDPTTNKITAINMSNSDLFYKFEAEAETSQLLEELQSGNASKFIQQTVNFSLANITQSKREVLEKLALAKITAICQYQSGEYFLAGIDGTGLKCITLTIDSGIANADLNGATVSLQGGSLGYANEIEASALDAILA